MSMSDTEFMSHIIAEICNYAVANGMEADDTLATVADNFIVAGNQHLQQLEAEGGVSMSLEEYKHEIE